MNNNSLVTLLSDFGDRDEYVAVMKGAIAQININLKVVDITHKISPQNIAAGRFCLMNAYPYFPVGTVHVAVVDPGVGGKRRAIATETSTGFLVAPDNGILSGVLSQTSVLSAVELTNSDYWRTPQPCTTFHGRDIFAPVGAHLASGVSLKELGTPFDPATLVKLDLPQCSQKDDIIEGCIQYIDYFGNLVTNIPVSAVEGKNWSVEIGSIYLAGQKTYTDVEIGEAIALRGSHGWVEIAINSGRAQLDLGAKLGDKVQISLQ